jgi:8-oxo-dGTP pyrophosphatase MutT (NUDIX family)
VILPPGAINAESVVPRPSATVLLIRGRVRSSCCWAPAGRRGFRICISGRTVRGRPRRGDEIKAAAIRELFEEAGILLAARAVPCHGERDTVRASGPKPGDSAGGLRPEPAFDRLVLMARWVTPAVLSRRYDAVLPRAHAVRQKVAAEGEVTGWLWTTPRAERPGHHARLRHAIGPGSDRDRRVGVGAVRARTASARGADRGAANGRNRVRLDCPARSLTIPTFVHRIRLFRVQNM